MGTYGNGKVPPTGKLRAVVADDHEVARTGLASMLRSMGNIEIVGEASDGQAAVQLVEKLDPDLLFVDVEMPLMSGVDVARTLADRGARTRIIALSAYDYREYVYGLLRSGASAYLKKSEANRANLEEAIESVVDDGEPWISSSLAHRLVMRHAGRDDSDEALASLTPREIELLRDVAHGCSNEEIALQHNLSIHTVKNHVDHIRSKIDLRTRAELVAWAWQNRLVSPR